MSYIQEHYLLIIGILLILTVIEGLIIYHNSKYKSKKRNKGHSSAGVSYEKYEKVREERNELRSRVESLKKQCKEELKSKEKELDKLKIDYQHNKDDYGKLILENRSLRNENEELKKRIKELEEKERDLTRGKEEQNKLPGNDPAPDVTGTNTTVVPTTAIPKSEQKEKPESNDSSKSSTYTAQDGVSVEVEQKENESKEDPKPEPFKEEPNTDLAKEKPKVESPKEKTMYASIPRSAGSNIYFSDLSENLLEDSYFELTISIDSGKATFKPLNFMKIRGYDPAMAAMRTEGVKPKEASTVLGIESGKAHIEGKDCIIDNPAIIKLA